MAKKNKSKQSEKTAVAPPASKPTEAPATPPAETKAEAPKAAAEPAATAAPQDVPPAPAKREDDTLTSGILTPAGEVVKHATIETTVVPNAPAKSPINVGDGVVVTKASLTSVVENKPDERPPVLAGKPVAVVNGVDVPTVEQVKAAGYSQETAEKIAAEQKTKAGAAVKPASERSDCGRHSARRYRVLADVEFSLRGMGVTWSKGQVRRLDVDTVRRAEQAGAELEVV